MSSETENLNMDRTDLVLILENLKQKLFEQLNSYSDYDLKPENLTILIKYSLTGEHGDEPTDSSGCIAYDANGIGYWYPC